MQAGNAELAAVMDIDPERARAVGTKYNTRYYVRERDLLKDKEVQAVYIGTPVHLHLKQVRQAARKGKHVLCEKPMAMTVKDCEKIIDVCRENGVKLGIGYMMRHHAHHVKAREMVQQGLLGRVVLARAQLSCWYPPMEGVWRQDPKLSGGGSLVDMGSHCLDTLEFILGSKVKDVCCLVDTLAHGYPVEDSATVLARFANGAHGVTDSFFSVPDASSRNRLEVYGVKGSLLAEGTMGQDATGEMVASLEKGERGYEAGQERTESARENVVVEPVNMYRAEIEDFSSCVESGAEPAVGGLDGLWSEKLMLACYKSAKTRKLVEVK